jgi:hypothetical protein
VSGIKTPLNEKPHDLHLSKTWDCWSPGTRVDFIEYTDVVKGWPQSALVRIKSEQVVIPLEYLVERRSRVA